MIFFVIYMFKELYKQMFQDLFGNLFRELKDIQQSDDWLGDKILSSLPAILGTLMGSLLYFIPLVVMHTLAALLTVLLIPSYWIIVKAQKILKSIRYNALHENRREKEEATNKKNNSSQRQSIHY